MEISIDRDSLISALRGALAPTPQRMQKVADFALSQVNERFATGGASGDEPWPRTDKLFRYAKEPPLDGLQETYGSRTEGDDTAIVSSWSWICLVHHLGKHIEPKEKGKRLYLPLTTEARRTYESHTRSGGTANRSQSGGKLVYGKDFILARAVDIPSRPQLPVADREIAEMLREIARIWTQE